MSLHVNDYFIILYFVFPKTHFILSLMLLKGYYFWRTSLLISACYDFTVGDLTTKGCKNPTYFLCRNQSESQKA